MWNVGMHKMCPTTFGTVKDGIRGIEECQIATHDANVYSTRDGMGKDEKSQGTS
jgi:hypothetical protein